MLYWNGLLLFLENNTSFFSMYSGYEIILTENFDEIIYLVSKCNLTMIKNRCFGTIMLIKPEKTVLSGLSKE